MTYSKSFAWLSGMLLFLIFQGHSAQAQDSLLDDVNPFIGTANQKSPTVNWKNGETFPGAIVPWGMVSVSPHTALGSKSGYIYGEPYLYGFGHVHLSGVGCGDLGNVVLMPVAGKIAVTPEGYKSSYGEEEASPGYYRTVLKPSGIVCEMTATTRTGISRYTFPGRDGEAHILIDASITENSKMMPARGYVKILSPEEVDGWTESGHFCGASSQMQKVYFVAVFSRPADGSGTWSGGNISAEGQRSGRGVGAYLSFKTERKTAICVKVGISYVSIENARLNLNTEEPGWDFEGVHREARSLWKSCLSRIRVEGGTGAEDTMFYTGLYHMMIHPSVFSDVNGQYLSMGHDSIGVARGYTRYDVYSLWDTYRGVHPFLTLFYPEREQDMIRSLLAMYRESHWLPKWELAGNDTYVMVGDPASNVLAETYLNGLQDFDVKLAYQAMKHNAEDTTDNPVRRNLKAYLKYHYVPANIRGSVSMTLEYCLADYSLARMAKILDKKKDYLKFIRRAGYYKNLYDSARGFLRPRMADGTWLEPFDPNRFKATGFIEGTAWNYLFCAPDGAADLAELMGGAPVYIRRLQQAFYKHKFVLYNEPDIAYPYLFSYFSDEAWRTQQAVHDGIAENYNTGPGGLPGNDDCGALSAWYVFSALGFYPADPLSGNYRLGSPLFQKVTIRLNQKYYRGKTLVIKTDRASDTSVFVRSVQFNGVPRQTFFISHQEIEHGGTLDVKMADKH